MGIGACTDGQKEIAAADYPQMRLFMVDKKTSGRALKDVSGGWKVCSPENVGA